MKELSQVACDIFIVSLIFMFIYEMVSMSLWRDVCIVYLYSLGLVNSKYLEHSEQVVCAQSCETLSERVCALCSLADLDPCSNLVM